MSAPADLATLQRWMQAVVVHHDMVADAIQSDACRRWLPPDAAAIVVPNDRMTSASRLDVYNGGYLTRLVDVLRSDFPGLEHALGADGFFDLARSYVDGHPSRHQNLTFFGREFSAFIGRRDGLPDAMFLSELAELEWAMTEVFHAAEFTPLSPDKIAAVPADRWPEAKLDLNPSVRFVSATYPVNAYLQSVFDGAEPDIPARDSTHVLLFRKDERVWRSRIPTEAASILQAMGRGETFGTALGHAGDHAESIGAWFQSWTADGLFTAVDIR